MISLEMKNYDMILTDRQQIRYSRYLYYLLQSGKIDNHEYFTGEEILHLNQLKL